MDKPNIPKGTRDFLPAESTGRNFIFNTLQIIFEKYGYLPIETPAMENLSTLLGKYGEEGDKLLYRVLNSGDFLSKTKNEDFDSSQKLISKISEKGLRYDLTVPFARFVVQNRNELHFPFKRYQIQPVWRADRPQKGRYREFYQCDVDIIGSQSLLNELELVEMIDEAFQKLGISVEILLNHRRILSGLADYVGFPDQIIDLTTAIDKLEKTGQEAVLTELASKGFHADSLEKVKEVLELGGDSISKLNRMRNILAHSNSGLSGIDEVEWILNKTSGLKLRSKISLDLTLARGLNYYTGIIIEVKARETAMGSICGGGRYDDLTGVFGWPGMPGVGVSFGADRIYDVMQAEGLLQKISNQQVDVLIINFGTESEDYSLQLARKIRKLGLSAEYYPDDAKLKKQMKYADQKKFSFVIMAGPEEIKSKLLSLKNMMDGRQQQMPEKDLLSLLKNF